jgi:hypothetical protein
VGEHGVRTTAWARTAIRRPWIGAGTRQQSMCTRRGRARFSVLHLRAFSFSARHCGGGAGEGEGGHGAR